MPDFSTELDAAIDDIDGVLGEPFVWNRYTYGTTNALAGTKGTATLAATATVGCVRTKTAVGLDSGGSGGRTGVERFEVSVRAAELSWTPTPDDTRVVFDGKTYKPTAVESECDGKVWRVRLERLASE